MMRRRLTRASASAALLAAVAAGCSTAGQAPQPASPPSGLVPSGFHVSAQHWAYVQATGGLVAFDPVWLPDGTLLLPVGCARSGVKPFARCWAEAADGAPSFRMGARVDGDNIHIAVLVGGMASSGRNGLVQAGQLTDVAPGEYELNYENPDGSLVALRRVVVPKRHATVRDSAEIDDWDAVPDSWFRARIAPEAFLMQDSKAAPEGSGRDLDWPLSNLLGRVDGFWTPAPQQVLRAERCIVDELILASARPAGDPLPDVPAWIPRLGGRADGILERLQDYRVEFVGVIVAGERRLIANFHIAGEPGLWGGLVIGGGIRFWGVQYDPETDRLLDFGCNDDA